jgi:predicted Co/Zn/Cd cation transporter (cation efflux family)
MLWCLASAALVMVLLALLALTSQPRHLIGYLKPTILLRGCLVCLCLSLAFLFGALALMISR